MHAVVVTAKVVAGQLDSARKVLREEIVPRVSKSPGFVKGYWTAGADGISGLSMAVFDTKEHADAAANMARTTPPPSGVTLGSVEVREVIAHA
jgi:hypothetical protein